MGAHELLGYQVDPDSSASGGFVSVPSGPLSDTTADLHVEDSSGWRPPPPASIGTYCIHVHAPDLRRFVFRRWWATATHGIAHMGDAGGGVWRARSKAKLIAKVERALRRDALSRGIRDPQIRIEYP